jgi:hypothetical protein
MKNGGNPPQIPFGTVRAKHTTTAHEAASNQGRLPMTSFTTKVTAIVCTVLLSTAMITAAVGPAEAGARTVVSAARVA